MASDYTEASSSLTDGMDQTETPPEEDELSNKASNLANFKQFPFFRPITKPTPSTNDTEPTTSTKPTPLTNYNQPSPSTNYTKSTPFDLRPGPDSSTPKPYQTLGDDFQLEANGSMRYHGNNLMGMGICFSVTSGVDDLPSLNKKDTIPPISEYPDEEEKDITMIAVSTTPKIPSWWDIILGNGTKVPS